jgi:transglutaminase-like putative cysteine protease
MSPEEGESPQDACQQQMSASYSRATMVGTKLQVTHRTLFEYAAPVIDSVNTLHLEPRTFPFQRTISATIRIMPPTRMRRFSDLFQNITHHFEMLKPHTRLEVQSRLRVHNLPLFIPERSREATKNDLADPSTRERTWQFLQDSNLISHHSGIWHTAVDLIQGLDSLHDQALAFMHWIHQNFHYQPGATMVNTSLANSFEMRAGVCQDFAHFMLACLRSVGVPARYVSGYLETAPPEGMERLTGADASHAWVSVFCGEEAGWVDLDPTNELIPGERHGTVAWGRAFSDGSPLRGVTRGAGGQTLQVAVDVIPLG